MSTCECIKCGKEFTPVDTLDLVCTECRDKQLMAIVDDNKNELISNDDWMELAKANSIPLYAKQPGETPLEYAAWCNYYEAYPGKLPTYLGVAEAIHCSESKVAKAGAKWSWKIRIQSWIAEYDNTLAIQRRQNILDMNKAHADIALTMRTKIIEGLKNVDTASMQVRDIVSLSKTMADLERTALVDNVQQDNSLASLSNPVAEEQRKSSEEVMTANEANEILQILSSAGVFGDNKKETYVNEELDASSNPYNETTYEELIDTMKTKTKATVSASIKLTKTVEVK